MSIRPIWFMLFKSFLLIFLVLSITEGGVFKSPTKIVDLLTILIVINENNNYF